MDKQSEDKQVEGSTSEAAKTVDLSPPNKTSTTAASSDTVVKKSGPGWGVWVLTLLIAVGAGAGAGYIGYGEAGQLDTIRSLQSAAAKAQKQAQQQSSVSKNLQQQLERGEQEAAQKRQLMQQQLNLLQQQQASQQKRILSLSTTDREDWLLAEAEYLLRLANQRLLMGKEILGAQKLLQSADDIVRELDDSGLYPVRQALASDMVALQTAGSLDVEGIYLQLGALAQQAGQLQLIQILEFQAAAPELVVAENWQQSFEVGLIAAWDKLSSLIRRTHREEVYKPMLAPEYEAAVRQNVRLMFEQAQMATLSAKQLLYKDSLNKAKYWLQTYYTLDPGAAEVVVTEIDKLIAQRVEVPLPDISSSLRALKNYMEAIHQIKPLPDRNETASQEQGQ